MPYTHFFRAIMRRITCNSLKIRFWVLTVDNENVDSFIYTEAIFLKISKLYDTNDTKSVSRV